MKKYAHTIRWVSELVLILAVLAAAPWVYKAFSTGGGVYYDPGTSISVSPDAYSLVAARPLVGNGVTAVFTIVRVIWYKDYQIGDAWYSDTDRRWQDSISTTLADGVQHRLEVDGDSYCGWDWTEDTTSFASNVLAYTDTLALNQTAHSFTLHVLDTIPHYTPGTTDDPGEFTANRAIAWVLPNVEITAYIPPCATNASGLTYSHDDTYISEAFNIDYQQVKFTDLWIHEVLEITSNACQVPFQVRSGTHQLDGSNRYGDILGGSGPYYHKYGGCVITVRQDIFLRATADAAVSQVHLWTNTLNYKFLAAGGWNNFVSKRNTWWNSAKCPLY